MAMELLSFHDEFVADFSPDDEHDYFISLDIVQGAQVSRTELELGERIGAQPLDRFRWRRRLVLQAAPDGRFQDSPGTSWQRPKLTVALLRDADLPRHLIALWITIESWQRVGVKSRRAGDSPQIPVEHFAAFPELVHRRSFSGPGEDSGGNPPGLTPHRLTAVTSNGKFVS
jgi:hypothetical protein